MGSTKALVNANWLSIAEVTVTAALGIAAIAAGFQGWAWLKTTVLERLLFIISGFALVYPSTSSDAVGVVFIAIALCSQYLRTQKLNTTTH